MGVGLAACRHLDDPRASTVLAGDALAALRAQYGVARQEFNYNPQKVETYRTAGGGSLAVGSQAFRELAGNAPAFSPLRMEVREVLTKADMVLSGVPTPAGPQVLESGGQYFVRVTNADRQQFLLSPRVKLGLSTPGPSQDLLYGMALYRADSPAGTDFGWVPSADTASSVEVSRPLYAGAPQFFRCLIAKPLYDNNYGWISYARPIYSGYAQTSVRVLTNQPAASSAAVYLVFKDYNAVAPVLASGAGVFGQDNIPTRTVATAIALCSVGGRLYYGQQTDTVRVGQVFNLQLTPRSLAEVAAEVRRLP